MTDDSSHNLEKSIRKRRWITGLLLVSTILASVLLWKSDPNKRQSLHSPEQLDTLITSAFDEAGVENAQFEKQTVQVDSVFSRSVYRVRVAPGFSKTTLHYTLQQAVWPYRVSTVGRIEFPARTLYLHFMINENILSSVIVSDDPDLLQQPPQSSI
ncbi:MAG: hypothetical protein R3283_01040 [Balneolaceae bacterium]|nr:hypothetical protein [Balneolaceae bacterium]